MKIHKMRIKTSNRIESTNTIKIACKQQKIEENKY